MFIQSTSTATKLAQTRHLVSTSTVATTAEAQAPADSVALSAAAQERTPVQNLMMFGGDRKAAIETLVASGAKAENPELSFFKDLGRKVLGFFGKSKSESKRISESQVIDTKVKLKDYRLENLSLTTTDKENGVTRTIAFSTQRPDGGKGEVKHIGELIGKGTPTMLKEQKIEGEKATGRKQINSYFDPKTGQKFIQATKELDAKSPRNMIEVLGSDGKPTTRYTFTGSGRKARGLVENLNAQGEVTNSYNVSNRRPEANYSTMLNKLANSPPSSRADFIDQLKKEAPAPTNTPAPIAQPTTPSTPKPPTVPAAPTTATPQPVAEPTPVPAPVQPQPLPAPAPYHSNPFLPRPCGCNPAYSPIPAPQYGYRPSPFGGNQAMMMWFLVRTMMMSQMYGYSGALPR